VIVLLQPPFFRLAGSHNDRPLMNLAYASGFLADAGVEHVLVNADWLGSPVHVPWRQLFLNEETWRRAVDGDSPLYDETLELVMQHRPTTVVIATGDDVIPTKNVGSPYTAAVMARRLKPYARVIGVGQFAEAYQAIDPVFDAVFPSMVNRSLVDLVLGEMPAVTSGAPLGSLPSFAHTQPHCVSDYVMSAFGCVYDCSFCWAPRVSGRQVLFQPLETVLADLVDRVAQLGHSRLYVADMIFPINKRRLALAAEMLTGQGFELSCECRVDLITPAVCVELARMGMKTVKLGIESIDDDTLVSMGKRTDTQQIGEAVAMLHEHGMKVVGYLIFGSFYRSEKAMWLTLERAQELGLDYVVVNVEAYQHFGPEYRYDAHFSMATARRLGVPEAVMWAALDLQERKPNPTVGKLPDLEI
jgi:hypothetical protein